MLGYISELYSYIHIVSYEPQPEGPSKGLHLRSHLELMVAQGQETSSSMWLHLTCGLETLGHEVSESQA